MWIYINKFTSIRRFATWCQIWEWNCSRFKNYTKPEKQVMKNTRRTKATLASKSIQTSGKYLLVQVLSITDICRLAPGTCRAVPGIKDRWRPMGDWWVDRGPGAGVLATCRYTSTHWHLCAGLEPNARSGNEIALSSKTRPDLTK